MKRILFLSLLICGQFTYAQQLKPIPTQTKMKLKIAPLTETENKNWWHYDIEKDSIPGISLDRAYKEIIKGKKGKEVIVAVLDTKLDIHHIELKDRIWTNKNEIPNNGIDDDKNGYIDDVNGWNFLGNAKGEDQIHQQEESTRIVKKFDKEFKNLNINEIDPAKKDAYQTYQRALKKYHEDIKKAKNKYISDSVVYSYFTDLNIKFTSIFSDKNYSTSELDSLQHKIEFDSVMDLHITDMKTIIKYNITLDDLKNTKRLSYQLIDDLQNINYNNRQLIGDDPNNIDDKFYGNNIVFGDVSYEHSTPVSGVISADRNNDLGLIGILSEVKIMPVVMVADGDEFDKDVALAIRYAVDNGADIINMSWGKSYSMNQEWVKDALIYASEQNVLLVTGSGNENANNDTGFQYFPSDYENETEFVNSFLSIGASNFKADQNLKASFSNYGMQNVDVFAPGDNIFTTSPHDKYENTRGTSLSAPITSGVAALVKSYYPQISAAQLKEILLASAVKYAFNVSVKISEKSQQINFTKLSKSGGIINAYNALLLAEQLTN